MKRVSSGVKGLNEMLGGGFNEGRIILVCGGPGTGKTIFSMQYILAAIKRGDAAVYVTLEEPLKLIKQNVSDLGWNIEQHEKEGILRLLEFRIVPNRGDKGKLRGNFKVETSTSVIDKIISAAYMSKAKHVIIDPITSIVIHESRVGMKRLLIGHLFNELRKLSCTSVVINETSYKVGDFYLEEFLADGVIRLSKDIEDYKIVKTIRIEKMRGIDYDEHPRRYTITSRGFEVFNNAPVLI